MLLPSHCSPFSYYSIDFLVYIFVFSCWNKEKEIYAFLGLTCLLSCSYAGALFADACLKGLNGVPDVVECSFVQSSVTELPFFASKVSEINQS